MSAHRNTANATANQATGEASSVRAVQTRSGRTAQEQVSEPMKTEEPPSDTRPPNDLPVATGHNPAAGGAQIDTSAAAPGEQNGPLLRNSRGSFVLNQGGTLDVEPGHLRHGQSANQRSEADAASRLLASCQRYVNSVRHAAEQESQQKPRGSGSHPHSTDKRSRHSGSERYQQSLQRFQQMVPKKHFKNDISDTEYDNMQSEAAARFKVPFSQAPNKVRPASGLSGLRAIKDRKHGRLSSFGQSPAPGTPTGLTGAIINQNAFVSSDAGNGPRPSTLGHSALTGSLQTLITRLQRQTGLQQPPMPGVAQDTSLGQPPVQMSTFAAAQVRDSSGMQERQANMLSSANAATTQQASETGFAFQLQNPITKVPEYNLEPTSNHHSPTEAQQAKLPIQIQQNLQARPQFGNDLARGSEPANNQKMQTQNQPAMSAMSQVNPIIDESQRHSAAAGMPAQEPKDNMSAAAANPSFPANTQAAGAEPNAMANQGGANVADSNPRTIIIPNQEVAGVNQAPARLDAGQGEKPTAQTPQPTRLLELLQSYLSGGGDLRKETQQSVNCQTGADDKSAQPQMPQDAQKRSPDAPSDPAPTEVNALQGLLSNGSYNMLQRLLERQQQASNTDQPALPQGVISGHGTSSLSNDQAQDPANAGLVRSINTMLASNVQNRPQLDQANAEPTRQAPAALRALQRRLSVASAVQNGVSRRESATHFNNLQTPAALSNDQAAGRNDRNSVNDTHNLGKMVPNERSPMQSQILQQLLSQGGLKLPDQQAQKALAEFVAQRQEGLPSLNPGAQDTSLAQHTGHRVVSPLPQVANKEVSQALNGRRLPDKSGEQANAPGDNQLSADSSDKGLGQNGDNMADSNLALLKYIKWQDQEIQRMKTLIVLQSMQANPSQHKTAASEASQPVMTPAILSEQIMQRTNQLQSAKQPQGNYSYPQTKEVEHLLQQQKVGALAQTGVHAAEIDRLRQMAATEGRAAADTPSNQGNLNHQLMNMLKIAGTNLNGGDRADASNLLGKRRLDQVQGFESEAQVRASLMQQGGNGLPSGADLSRLAGQGHPNTLPEDRRISEWRSREPDSLAQSRALISTLTDQLKRNDSAQRMGGPDAGSSSQAHLNESRFSLPDADYNSDEETCKTQLIKIRQQLHANLDEESYRSCRGEILDLVRKHQHAHAMGAIVIDAKPKRAHDRVGGNGFRGSQYRGVSKNKFKWQMMIMINQKKVYLGAIRGEKIAALFYDYIAIMSQGVGAKTNFSYTATDLGRILEIFQKKEDKANYTLTGATTASIHSSALPGIENVESAMSKRRRVDGSDDDVQSGIVTPKQNLKEDMMLASQVFSKETSQIDQMKQTSDSTGPKQTELTKDGFLQRLLAIQGQKSADRGPQAEAQQPALPLNLQLLANYLHANQGQSNTGKQSGVQGQPVGQQKFYQTPNRPKDAAEYGG